MPRILLTGSVAYDLTLQYDGSFGEHAQNVPPEDFGLTFVTSHFARHHGGTAANIARGIAQLGGRSLPVASVGTDGAEYLSLLESEGIDTTFIYQTHEDVCSTAILATDSLEKQVILYHPGADGYGDWPDLSAQAADIAYGIASPREERFMFDCLRFCAEHSIPCFFDPGQRIFSMTDDDFRRGIDLGTGLIANTFEWNVLCDRLQVTADDLLQELDIIIVTRSDAGVSLYTQEGEQTIAAPKADKVLNPTGAGDAFRAGLLTELTEGKPLPEAARLGAAMGSLCVESAAPVAAECNREKVEERMKKI